MISHLILNREGDEAREWTIHLNTPTRTSQESVHTHIHASGRHSSLETGSKTDRGVGASGLPSPRLGNVSCRRTPRDTCAKASQSRPAVSDEGLNRCHCVSLFQHTHVAFSYESVLHSQKSSDQASLPRTPTYTKMLRPTHTKASFLSHFVECRPLSKHRANRGNRLSHSLNDLVISTKSGLIGEFRERTLYCPHMIVSPTRFW